MHSHNSQEVFTENGNQSEYAEYVKGTNVLPYLLGILEDCKRMIPLYGDTDYRRDIETLTRRYTHEGLSFATKTLPDLFDSLLCYLETGNSAYPGFKCRANHPVFLQKLFMPIYEDHTTKLSAQCVECLYQLCAAFKKLKGPYKQSVLVKQLNEFIEVDRSLNFNLSACDQNTILVLKKARNIIRQVLDGLNPFDVEQAHRFIPRPGPGATNTPTEKHTRYRPHMFDAQLADFGLNEWYQPPFYPPRGKRPWDLRVGKSTGKLRLPTRNLLSSRLKFVHKTFGKARGICIEELEMQWLQQALRRAMYDVIEKHPLTKGYVSFTDQTINGQLALLASSNSVELATIDMSSASDRISRTLVEYLFQDNKAFLKALLSLSTRIVALPKELSTQRYLELRKFAPMGSALCFPVMGLIHFALIKSIVSTAAPQHINDIPVYVYGDDIIVETKYASKVIQELPLFGMKLNKEKSFYRSLFRESCGVHAYNGMLVTPVRFKSIVHNRSSVNDLAGLLEQESVLYKRGYRSTAKVIRDEFHKVPKLRADKFPTVGPKSPILGWIRGEWDARLSLAYQASKKRWNSDLQCYFYKMRELVNNFDEFSPILCEEEFYLRKLVENPEPWQTRKMNGVSKGLSIRWTWHADSALGFFPPEV